MWVTYSPADGDEQRWEFLAGDVLAVDAEAVERAFADTWDTWLVQLLSGGARARRVLLWHLIRRDHASLRFDDVPDFKISELKVEYDRDELQTIRDNVVKAQLDEKSREALLTHVDSEIAKAPEGTSGKARSKPKGSATASRSPAS